MLTQALTVIALFLLSTATTAQILSPRGYGDVEFGGKLRGIEARLKQRAEPRIHHFDCDFVSFKKYPGISFMVENGIITRGEITSNMPTSGGVHVGMRLDEVKRRYPKIRVEPHKYVDGHYLILPTSTGKAGLLFEETDGQVTGIRAGLFPSIEYVEGCS